MAGTIKLEFMPVVVAMGLLCLFGCNRTHHPSATRLFESQWPEADLLFRCDPHWIGADGGYSIDLSNGRILWLFGDSWINPRGKGTRRNATMVSNTMAIQHGYDPSKASIEFFWGNKGSRTEAYFPDGEGVRYWPGNGIVVEDRLILFLMNVWPSDEGLGFKVSEWSAVLVTNPEEDPDKWNVQWLDCPQNDLQIIVGAGGILTHDGYVYAYSPCEGSSKHDIYLTRWLQEDLREGRIASMQWWCGDQQGWQKGSAEERAVPVFSNAQTEFTVHFDEERQLFVETQSEGFGHAVIVQRTSTKLTGPWSDKKVIYDPPENRFERIMIYQGKAHPYFQGAKLVITYCTNSFDFADHLKEPWLDYPCFIRID